jgi:hypothetical protein
VIQLVDDQLLGSILRGGKAPHRRAEVYTTGLWYVRLCQAVLGAAEHPGALSRPFNALPTARRERALQSLLELPESIGLLSLRELAPRIGHLRRRHELNVLGIEALAAALHLEATVYLSAPSPRLEAALTSEGQRVTVVV